MKTKEVEAHEIKVGDVIVAKQGGRLFTVKSMMGGMGGERYPYLTVTDEDGKEHEHDTGIQPYAKYTIKIEDWSPEERNAGND